MSETSKDPPLDPYKDILGVDFTPERLDENLRAFADILQALRKLRELDLTEVHPAVVFDPAGPYRDATGS
jgi:putative NADH-flavin reductase